MKGQTQSGGRFGAIGGVFTPTVLTILGLILFLRMGWVVGQAGLAGALIIICLANLISFFTGLSLSSIATNMRVRTGGPYYMISRTLGLEIGGAIGIPLYLSQAISVAFYLIGFTEAFLTIQPDWDPRIVATVLAMGFGLLALVGADFIIKVQFLILAVLALALASFFLGPGEMTSPQMFRPEQADAGFWTVFAIYFPAVTGIMVGVSMSGDLKDARRSIPMGTLWAIGATFLVYVAVAFWLAFKADTETLLTDMMIMQSSARWPALIIAGVWVSTLSSALGSILAAPRTLQAIAHDRAVPHVLGSRLGSATEPRLAVIITTGIALIVIWMGNLDFVAPVITMFFLNTYGMINLMAGIEKLVDNPSFRPRFNVHWLISLLGAAGCYGAMFLINPWATIVAVAISYGVFLVLKRRSLQQDWGDIRSGLWFTITRSALSRLDRVPWHAKNWRPNIIVFTTIHRQRPEVMELGATMTRGGGIITFYNLLVGDLDDLTGRGLRTTASRRLKQYLKERGVQAFVNSAIVGDFVEGVLLTLQTYGLAGLEPNTALMGWGRDPETRTAQMKLLVQAMALKKSVLFLHCDEIEGLGNRRRIDIWWRGLDRNAGLMLVLAHVIQRSRSWEGAQIRVLRLVDREEGREGAEEHIQALLASARVEAEPVVMMRERPEESFADILARTSKETDLTMIGLGIPQKGYHAEQAERIEALVQAAGDTLLVRSGEGGDILNTTSTWTTLDQTQVMKGKK